MIPNTAPAPVGTITLSDGRNSYEFNIWPRSQRFNAIGVVYVMARKADNNNYNVIYVGQTGDASQRPFNHHRKECFDRHGADYVLLRTEPVERRRFEIETALIRYYSPPCNQQ